MECPVLMRSNKIETTVYSFPAGCLAFGVIKHFAMSDLLAVILNKAPNIMQTQYQLQCFESLPVFPYFVPESQKKLLFLPIK